MRISRRPSMSRHSRTMRRPTATRIPQPGRRRLGLEAENRKVNAQVGPRISWIR